MEPLCREYGVRAVISKGGMPEEIYQQLGDALGVVFLTTMGYGLGAIYGHAVKHVNAVYWMEQLGISEAMWVLECDELGPLMVEGDTLGNSFFAEHRPKSMRRSWPPTKACRCRFSVAWARRRIPVPS